MKPSGQFILIGFAIIVSAANLAHLPVAKFRISVLFAGACTVWTSSHSVPVARCRASLSFHVVSVYLMRTKEQMFASDTGLVIALMANQMWPRINANVKMVGNTVGSVVNALFAEASVTRRLHKTPSPYPTGSLRALPRRVVYLRSKALDVLRRQFGKFTILNRHDITSDSGCGLLRAASGVSAPLRLAYCTA